MTCVTCHGFGESGLRDLFGFWISTIITIFFSIDVKKPVDTLLPIVKECLNYEEEILNSLYECKLFNSVWDREGEGKVLDPM